MNGTDSCQSGAIKQRLCWTVPVNFVAQFVRPLINTLSAHRPLHSIKQMQRLPLRVGFVIVYFN